MNHTQRILLVTAFLLSTQNLSLLSEDLLSGFKPREIGPSVFGGRVVDIEVDAKAAHRIFVASASGGLWLSENNGTTWKNIFENEKTISIGDVAIDPNDSKIIWVGTGEANNQRSSLWGNGVYKSTNGGESWTHLGLDDTHHIGRIVIDPSDSNVAYVAALGHLYSSNAERGLFKTTDGGKSWEKILFVNEHIGVVDLVIDKSNPKNLYAATYERLRRAWNFDGAGPGSAIYKSSDGGKSWKKLTKGLPTGNIGRIGLAIFDKNPKVLFATVSNQNPAPPSSNNGPRSGNGRPNSEKKKTRKQESPKKESANDRIETPFGFSIKQSGEGFSISGLDSSHPAREAGLSNRTEIISLGGVEAKDVKKMIAFLKGLKASDQVVLVGKNKDKTITITVSRPEPVRARRPASREIGGEVYRSDDGGESWTKVNSQPVGGTPAYYYGQIRIDPQDENRLYILSVPLYTSTDGGKTWSSVARSVHVDHHALWINPNSPNHIMLGNDGGFHQSYDYGQTMDHYLNIPISQFYAMTVDMQEPYHIYGGTQDNGSWGGPSKGPTSFRGGGGISPLHWYRIGGGDGFYVQVDPKNPNFYIAESQFGAIFKADRATGMRKSIRPRPQNEDESYRFNWSSPILMSQHDSRVIYFGGNKLFKSMNQGDDWEEISDDLTTADSEKISGNVPHCTLTTIAESPKDKNLLMIGTDDGKVQLTKDGGKTWVDCSENFPFRPKEWWCSRVVLSNHDANTAYVTFTGYREDDFRCFVFKTTDLGKTWHSLAGDLPEESVNVIQEDRVNPNLLYVGTEFGCYVSLDGGKHWNQMPGLPRVSVHDLLVHPRDNDLVLGTHGRGFYVVDDISALQQLNLKPQSPVQLLKPRNIKTASVASAPSLSGDRQFQGSNPSSVGQVWYRVHSKSDDKYKLVVTGEDGKDVFSGDIKSEPGLYAVPVNIRRAGFGRTRSSRGGAAPNRRGGARQGNPDSITVTPGTYTITLKGSKPETDQVTRLVVE